MKDPNISYFFALIILLCSINLGLEEHQRELDEKTKENFIIIYFGKNVSYGETEFAMKIASRQNISSIKLEDSEKKKDEALDLKENSKVEIHFDTK